jgi:hypothetical protein
MSNVIVNGASAGFGYAAGGTVQSFNYTVPAGSNCIAILEGSGTYGGTPPTPSGITYNGVSAVMVPSSSAGHANAQTSIWLLLNPPTGSSYVLEVTYPTSVDGGGVGVVPLANVNTGAPYGTAATASGSGANSNVTAAGAASTDLYVGVQISGVEGAGVTPGGAQTNQFNVGSRGGWGTSGDTIAGGGSGAFAWTETGLDGWAASAVAFKAAVSALLMGQICLPRRRR